MQLFSQISEEQSHLDLVGDELDIKLSTCPHFVPKQRGSERIWEEGYVRYVDVRRLSEYEVRDQVRVRTTFRF